MKKQKRINLKKIGLVRAPDEDFTDDGNRFTCYKYNDWRISYHRFMDEVFISARKYLANGKTEYVEDLNGFPVRKITDSVLADFKSKLV